MANPMIDPVDIDALQANLEPCHSDGHAPKIERNFFHDTWQAKCSHCPGFVFGATPEEAAEVWNAAQRFDKLLDRLVERYGNQYREMIHGALFWLKGQSKWNLKKPIDAEKFVAELMRKAK